MLIRIDLSSEEPIYLQIRSQIVQAVASGDLCAGDALPSVRSLAGDLGAAEASTDAAAETHCPPDKSSPKSRIAKPFFEYIPSK